MLGYHYWICKRNNGSTEVKWVQRNDDGHGGCGFLALHPALWSLVNTFHAERLNGFAGFGTISLCGYFLQLFMLVQEPHPLQSHSLH